MAASQNIPGLVVHFIEHTIFLYMGCHQGWLGSYPLGMLVQFLLIAGTGVCL